MGHPAAKTEAKVEPVFAVQIKDGSGEVVVEVERTLQVRRK